MKGRNSLALLPLLALLILAGIAAVRAEPFAKKGQKLFTKFSLFYEKGHHITTNYRKGILIPINSEAEFVKSNKDQIIVHVPEYNIDLRIINEEDYSGEKIEGIFHRTFGEEATDLSQFSEMERSNIRKGTLEAGMSRDAVIKAMGYPPRHKTPSLKMDQWRYWRNRFNTILVIFDGDKVSEIRE